MTGFLLQENIPAITVFLEGLVSFFSPCVLPLIPLYIGYLAGGTRRVDKDGKEYFSRKKVAVNTIFFVLGISFTLFLLGFGASALGNFFKGNRILFARVGGALIIAFGLYQLGLFGSSVVLNRQHRLPFRLKNLAMSPFAALVMGFTFSFAWTPCVGPVLTSVLLMAAAASAKTTAFLLIGVYTLGFVLPFLAVGLFSASLLDLFKRHASVVKYSVKIGGLLMILIGILMFVGKFNSISGYLSEEPSVLDPGSDEKQEAGKKPDEGKGKEEKLPEEKEKEAELSDAFAFELHDQYGNVHRLADYRGKVIFLNFWATWCPHCVAEMADIQKLYEKYEGQENSDVAVLGVAAPSSGKEMDEAGIIRFLKAKGYTYPVLMDEKEELFGHYGILSFPTTFMVTKDAKVFGYVTGELSPEIMESIIDQTLSGKRQTGGK